MASSSTPAVNETVQYGAFPTYLVAKPYKTIASAASVVEASASFGATQLAMTNNLAATMYALGFWATS
jgi:hypothetical protein